MLQYIIHYCIDILVNNNYNVSNLYSRSVSILYYVIPSNVISSSLINIFIGSLMNFVDIYNVYNVIVAENNPICTSPGIAYIIFPTYSWKPFYSISSASSIINIYIPDVFKHPSSINPQILPGVPIIIYL